MANEILNIDDIECYEQDGRVYIKTNTMMEEKIISKLLTLGAASVYLYEALKEKDKQKRWKIMNNASILFHPLKLPEFNELYGAAAINIAWQQNLESNEFYYHSIFKEVAEILIPGCKLVNHHTDNKNIPDAFIELLGELIPVEIKVEKFDNKALNQLNRYINAYGSNAGVAIGREYTATDKVNKNIIFYSINQLENIKKKLDDGRIKAFHRR